MFNKKAQIKGYLIAIIVFTMVIMAGLYIINSFRDVDSSFMDNTQYGQYNSTFNHYDELKQKIDSTSASLNATPEQGTFGILNGLISSSWATLKTIGSSFSFMNSAINGLSAQFSIDSRIIGLIISIITIMILFGIYKLIFQVDS